MSKDYMLASVAVENVMGCKCFYWTRNGWGLVSLKGDNEAGKSSALTGLVVALAGRRAMPPEILRRGERSWGSRVVLETLDGTESYTVMAGGKATGTPTLKVLDAEGEAVQMPPQAFLDSIVSGEQLDPLKFLRAKPAEQQQMLMRALKVDFDLDKWTADRKGVYDSRTKVNQRQKAAQAQAEGLMGKAEAAVKAKAAVPDSADTAAKMDAASKHNGQMSLLKTNIGMKQAQGEQQQSIMRSLKAQLSKAEAIFTKLEDEKMALEDQLRAMEPVDTAALQSELSAALMAGAISEKAANALARWYDADTLAKESDALTQQLAEMDAARKAALTEVEMPIEGLEFTEDGLRYNGFPIDQTSTGKGLTIAAEIAAAAEPHLRFLCIDDGSVLDQKNWNELGEVAEKRKLNIFVLAVDHGQPGILIKDGEVVEE